MPRPLKTADDKRDFTVEVRVTSAEKSAIKTIAKENGMTVSDFLRNLAVVAKVKRRIPDTDQELLIRIKGELGMIGSNVNQIARALNRRAESGERVTVSDASITDAMDGVDALTKHILELLGYGH